MRRFSRRVDEGEGEGEICSVYVGEGEVGGHVFLFRPV